MAGSRVPAHRRRRNPLDRQVLGTYRPPPTNMADCRCAHPWRQHHPQGMDGRGECLHPRCKCQGYRDFGATRGDSDGTS